ncbi:four helix bundle protein [Pontiella sp.]|uniref:four helix bundle protein n=1 Tax=Pontiella sp. TaxID=2837462 RepID=UPI0035661533
MNYAEWEEGVPTVIRNDSLWTMEAYRLSLFLADISWKDAKKLSADNCTRSLSDQLYRSVGSMSANIEEGYSKQSSKDRARFYEYALGSARESRGWYYKGRHVLGTSVAEHRMDFTTQIIRLLIKMVPDQRGYKIKEDIVEYVANTSHQEIPF